MFHVMIGSQFIYATYAPSTDMTFIMKDTYIGTELDSTECMGWHHGEPDLKITEQFIGKLKAEYRRED